MKICKKCGIEKEDNAFNKGRYKCKICRRFEQKQYDILNNLVEEKKYKKRIRRIKYRLKNKERIRKRHELYKITHKNKLHDYYLKNKELRKEEKKIYYKENKVTILEEKKIYYIKHKKEINARHNEWQRKNKDDISKKRKLRMHSDLNFKLGNSLRNRLCCAINNNQKVGSAVKDLGCSIDFLKKHLESLFLEGMSWDNWGQYKKSYKTWHIDHITPLSFFNLEDALQFLIANHWTNLQPLWAIDNLSKNDKIGGTK